MREYAKEEGLRFGSMTDYKIHTTANGKTYNGDINLTDFGKGAKEASVTETAKVTLDGKAYNVNRTSKAYIYQQDYSVVAGFVNKASVISGNGVNDTHTYDEDDYTIVLKGTTTQVLPTAGKAVYRGEAVTEHNASMHKGTLDYIVDFDKKVGSGKITSPLADVYLYEGVIKKVDHINDLDGSLVSGYGIEGRATGTNNTGSGEYGLGFFGANAEEIAGAVELSNKTIGFGGKKQ